jgi:transcriptional regulator with XRE-family HTH domain
MNFSEKILGERKRLGLTQAGAADLLDISKSALEKWESGIKIPIALTQEGALARMAGAAVARGKKTERPVEERNGWSRSSRAEGPGSAL